MKMKLLVAAVVSVAATMPALAQDYLEYPAPYPYPFQRSYRTAFAAIPPYRYPFVVRTYTTPPQQPYYNVPPYSVIAPY